ncbi:MYG1 family protein [Jonesia quinghaiensis]|uniref:MYG1 family protein n=1 Tax=Jonesia quinghaiensis TaxID=262806 RepID=UPI000409DCE6|nr:MYG1 family protein [Jonesia quinghaiensis]
MIIATHNGKFHADDVFGVALLTEIHPDATIVRTRDPQRLAEADIVLDVGGEYNTETRRYDHHQKSSGARPNGILYSAFGLLWQDYGRQWCNNDDVWLKIDTRLVTAIDAVDNGQDLYSLTDFGIRPFDLSEYLGLFNPIGDDEDFDSQFTVAVELARTILHRLKAKYVAVLDAERYFQQAYAASPDRRYVILERYIPHGGISSKQPELLYTVYPGATGNWTIQAVRPDNAQFSNRKDLPAAWRGLNGSELAEVTGVADAVFCHKAGFICAAQTRDGAQELLRQALEA